ncbi:MAG: hypothetical protein V7776_06720 [Halopseudomonas aestusnigri]
MATFFKKLQLILAAGLLAVTAFTSPTSAAVTNPYPVEFEEVLAKFHINKSNIRSQKTLVKHTDVNDGQRIAGYDTYIRFKDCKGYLRIFQHRFGRVEKVYTKGECEIPGIKNF